MRILFILLCALLLGNVMNAQPGTKKTTVKKTAKPVVKLKPMPARKPAEAMLSRFEDGRTLFDIQSGDTLVYDVYAMGDRYEFWVIVKKYDHLEGISFDWKMTAPVSKNGHVLITKEGLASRSYNNYFKGGELKLSNASTVWLTSANFSDLSSGETKMNLDNGGAETFYNEENNEVTPEIDYRGTTIKLDAFKLTNKKSAFSAKEIHALNISGNPLIVYMNLGWTITLKAVR